MLWSQGLTFLRIHMDLHPNLKQRPDRQQETEDKEQSSRDQPFCLHGQNECNDVSVPTMGVLKMLWKLCQKKPAYRAVFTPVCRWILLRVRTLKPCIAGPESQNWEQSACNLNSAIITHKIRLRWWGNWDWYKVYMPLHTVSYCLELFAMMYLYRHSWVKKSQSHSSHGALVKPMPNVLTCALWTTYITSSEAIIKDSALRTIWTSYGTWDRHTWPLSSIVYNDLLKLCKNKNRGTDKSNNIQATSFCPLSSTVCDHTHTKGQTHREMISCEAIVQIEQSCSQRLLCLWY